MTFENETEAQFWRAVIVAYAGSPANQQLPAMETADLAVKALRERMPPEMEPYVQLTRVNMETMNELHAKFPERRGVPYLMSPDGRLFPKERR